MAVVLFYIVFVTLLVVANVALHWYLWRRLVTDTQLTGALRGVVGSTIVVLGVLVPINFAVSRVFGRDVLFSIPSVVWTW